MIDADGEIPDEPADAALTAEELRRGENRRHSLANLRPWKPGQSGNPVGARHRKGRTTKRREIVLEAEAAVQASRETSLQYLRRLL
jgi:hypothetical protein